MNEVFETIAEVFEELRSEAGEREYSGLSTLYKTNFFMLYLRYCKIVRYTKEEYKQ